MESPAGRAPRLTMVQWLVCVIAAIGFAFDIYELLMLPLVFGPAAQELAGLSPGNPATAAAFANWRAAMFYVPALAGGAFGLYGGYLTDRFGRRSVLTWSILIYAFSAFAAGFSTSLPMLLFFRCTTFVGVCIEFVAAVAWLAELFPDAHQREKVLGYTQAFSSVGGLLVAMAFGAAIWLSDSLPPIALPDAVESLLGAGIANAHAPWRYTLISGLIPAIPLIIIRPFLPESPAWSAKRAAGTLKRPSIKELFAPQLRRTTIVTAILFACSYGAAFGAIQHMPEIVKGFSEVNKKADAVRDEAAAKVAKNASATPAEKKAGPAQARGLFVQKAGGEYTKIQEIGGLVGRFLLAMLAVVIVSRRKLLWIFQVPALFALPLIFYAFAVMPNQFLFVLPFPEITKDGPGLHGLEITTKHLLIFVAGLLVVAQFSFWGNYLPRVYPMHLRGTGESFAANVGGRMIGTSFAAVTTYLATSEAFKGLNSGVAYAYSSAGVVAFVCVVGVLASFWLPEPPTEMHD